MDVLFLVVDSLRAHPFADGRVAATPYLDSLSQRALHFSRAYATECWTLPSHASMFTGLMPSEHGAHFHTMAYRGESPTLAELMRERGYRTELVTRNFVFDGTIPGINRGFDKQTQVLSDAGGFDPIGLLLALAKPRFRRHLRNTGFFHPHHKDSREFLQTFAHALRPADGQLLEYLVERMSALRSAGEKSFMFANLYDVHAPYAPSDDSLLCPWTTLDGIRENLTVPYALSRLGEHRYLKEGFSIAESVRAMLEARYRRAVELMDRKLATFFAELDDRNLLDDRLVILVSDHGEGFGEHGLFLHDASLYETHLRVPLWLILPGESGGVVDDVVSTRHLFGLVNQLVGSRSDGTIVDEEFRAAHPVALAQHFSYPHLSNARRECRGNQFAAVGSDAKVVVQGGEARRYDLRCDGSENDPHRVSLGEALRDPSMAGSELAAETAADLAAASG